MSIEVDNCNDSTSSASSDKALDKEISKVFSLATESEVEASGIVELLGSKADLETFCTGTEFPIMAGLIKLFTQKTFSIRLITS